MEMEWISRGRKADWVVCHRLFCNEGRRKRTRVQERRYPEEAKSKVGAALRVSVEAQSDAVMLPLCWIANWHEQKEIERVFVRLVGITKTDHG